jgi:hypothetical protein
VLKRFRDRGQEPLAHGAPSGPGSALSSIVCSNLPSRDRKGSVAWDGFPPKTFKHPETPP